MATQPTVIATAPANGATFVPTNQVLTAAFSKLLNPATVNATTFLLKGPGGAAVTGTVTYNATGSVASFTPSVALTYNTTYTATITTAITDSTGDPLAANYTWSFTTAVQPVVLSTVPLNGATGVALNQVLSATFSQTMNCATLASPATSFMVTGPGTTAVAGTVASMTSPRARGLSTLKAIPMRTGYCGCHHNQRQGHRFACVGHHGQHRHQRPVKPHAWIGIEERETLGE